MLSLLWVNIYSKQGILDFAFGPLFGVAGYPDYFYVSYTVKLDNEVSSFTLVGVGIDAAAAAATLLLLLYVFLMASDGGILFLRRFKVFPTPYSMYTDLTLSGL